MPNIWDDVLGRIEAKVNRHSYYTWFKPTAYVGVRGDELVVRGSLEERSFVAFYCTAGRVLANWASFAFQSGRDMTQVLIKQSKRRRTVPVEVGCYIMAEALRGLKAEGIQPDQVGGGIDLPDSNGVARAAPGALPVGGPEPAAHRRGRDDL